MTHKTDIAPSLRVPPAVWPGVLIYLAYMAMFYAVFVLVGIDYAHISASADTLLGIIAVTVVIIVLARERRAA
ncbi:MULTISPECIES: hypothetical protein [unclassified Janthinobacterium]|uniref:hypothetical protein n=1 Tax=unclassified Janthinobacterium TaxID=2610881 RepID=UPI00160948C8|nr:MULTISPECIES: hypothetical protein [unclassified Janthinobacterium]MBB5608005.1 hypothetical protein [Janthinobacterium sp. S3T4]MBB5613254.1 hypothetical protein [Janthinobacterium sp. S3M3]